MIYMSKKMMYCRKCGEKLEENAAFCRYCGCRIDIEEVTADTGRKSGPEKTDAGQDVSRSNGSKKKKKTVRQSGTKSGIKFLAVVAAAAVFAVTAFKYPGFLLPKDETKSVSGKPFDTGLIGTQIDYTATTETDILSQERKSTRFEESGVEVTLTDWILDEGQEEKLEVKSIEPVYAPNDEYVIKPYEVTLGDMHELTDFIEIRLPYDTSFCEAGENPAECVGGLYYNEDNSAWEEVLYTIDSDAKEIVIETDHFSKFGAITFKNKGCRDAMLCMSEEKIDENFDIGYINEDQAVQVMKNFCDTASEESTTAKLAGNQVLQTAMNLGGSVSTVSDGMGTAFNIMYYLDLSDVAMAGRYVEDNVWNTATQRYGTVSYSNNMFNTYNADMINKAGKTLSRIGNCVSACKLVYLVSKAGTGNADQSEIWDLYKESANMYVSIAGGATMGALMGPIFIADTFINYVFEEAMDIKDSQIEDMYIYFNTKYPGCSYPEVRPGRSAKDWRDIIIKLIEENPEADTAELLEEEINTFANEFWTLDSDQMADVVAQMPKTIKRITVDDERIRTKITDGYKKELYTQMTGVLTSVRNYYNKKMVLKTEQQISAAAKFYNQKITFDIVEEDPDKEIKYGGFKCRFAPLSEDAELSNWTSTLPEDGLGLHGEMTLIGHITSGSPTHLLVYDKDADMTQDEPVLMVPFVIDKNNHIQIILSEPEEQSSDIARFMGKWYDTESKLDFDLIDMGDGRIQFYGVGLYWVEYKYEFDPVQRKLTLSENNITGYRECETLNDSNSMLSRMLKKGMVFTFSEDGLRGEAQNNTESLTLVRLDEFMKINAN